MIYSLTIGNVLVSYNSRRKKHPKPRRAPVKPVPINTERKEIGELLYQEAAKYRRQEKYARALLVLELNRSDIEYALGRSIDKEIFEARVLTMVEKAHKVLEKYVEVNEYDEVTYQEVTNWIKENENNKYILKILMSEEYDFDDLKATLVLAKASYLADQGRIVESKQLYRENEKLLDQMEQRAEDRLERLKKKQVN